MRVSLVLPAVLLALFCHQAVGDQMGDVLAGAGAVGEGMRKAEKERQEARLRQLQIQEANRRGEIQKLEYQLRMLELEQRRQELERRQETPTVGTRGFLTEGDEPHESPSLPMSQHSYSSQIASAFEQQAPFRIADGVILEGATTPLPDELFVDIRFVEVVKGPDVYYHSFLSTQKMLLTEISCKDDHVFQFLYSGGSVFYTLFDRDGVAYTQQQVKLSDCR